VVFAILLSYKREADRQVGGFLQKNVKNLSLAVKFEKTEINIL